LWKAVEEIGHCWVLEEIMGTGWIPLIARVLRGMPHTSSHHASRGEFGWERSYIFDATSAVNGT